MQTGKFSRCINTVISQRTKGLFFVMSSSHEDNTIMKQNVAGIRRSLTEIGSKQMT